MFSVFQQLAADKTRRAESAEIDNLQTVEDRSDERRVIAVGNDWTRQHYDGSFYLLPIPDQVPAVSLVMVQSREGNTGADDPSDLGGGDTDRHLIYEGLTRVAADAVLAGRATATGRVFFSVWHPEMVTLRRQLGLPRHPAQIVISKDGNLDLDGTLLFNVPSVAVFIIAGAKGLERCAPQLSRRPWITMIGMGANGDLAAPLGELRARNIRRISAVGGRSSASALIDARLVQDVCLTTTSLSAGEPGTPFYVGSRSLRSEPIVRKRSSDARDRSAIQFDQFAVVVTDSPGAL
jgi:riboflavin biosynthesis pyrimidine reductase